MRHLERGFVFQRHHSFGHGGDGGIHRAVVYRGETAAALFGQRSRWVSNIGHHSRPTKTARYVGTRQDCPVVTSLSELFRFGVVGVLATIVHYIVAILSVEAAGLVPLVANVIAFGCAFPVSFVGHLNWTFRDQTDGHSAADRRHYWGKFFATALAGLAVSQLVVFVLADALDIYHRIAFAAALVLAPTTVFVLSKFWAFRPAR